MSPEEIEALIIEHQQQAVHLEVSEDAFGSDLHDRTVAAFQAILNTWEPRRMTGRTIQEAPAR